MFKFLTNKKTKVIPIEYEQRKTDWSFRSINSVLPETKASYDRRNTQKVKI